ncbi:MAG: hypothetical protein JXA71_04865 [Chitinispirillaceae bacterium]|nr:hypothetical protein [Chitinispirillaceae bacterium]
MRKVVMLFVLCLAFSSQALISIADFPEGQGSYWPQNGIYIEDNATYEGAGYTITRNGTTLKFEGTIQEQIDLHFHNAICDGQNKTTMNGGMFLYAEGITVTKFTFSSTAPGTALIIGCNYVTVTRNVFDYTFWDICVDAKKEIEVSYNVFESSNLDFAAYGGPITFNNNDLYGSHYLRTWVGNGGTVNCLGNYYDFCSFEEALLTDPTASPTPNCVDIVSLTATGFEAPLANGPVTVNKNRCLPVKTELYLNGIEQTSQDIVPPVIQVLYSSSSTAIPAEDVSSLALSPGQSNEGNAFIFTEEGKWQYNLKMTNFTGKGTYTIKILSGDDSKYTIEQTYNPAHFIVK